MNESSGAAVRRWFCGFGRQIFALRCALAIVAVATSLRADEQQPFHRLPPVSQAVAAWSSDLSSAVTFPEDAEAAGANQLAPGDPPFQLVSREEPVLPKVGSDYQLLRFVEPPQPPTPSAAGEEPSPFLDENAKPAEPEKPGDAGKDKQKKDGEPQKLGQQPVSNSLQFLRTQDVLLNPGDWQFDTGFAYTLFDDDFPIPVLDGGGDVIGVVQAHLRDRLIYTPLAFRYGWSKNVQLFGVLPTGFSNTQFSTVGESDSLNSGGIGDLTAGASLHLLAGEDTMPDVVGTLAFTAPTGDFNAPVGSVIPGTALGQGFWAISAQVLFINRYDPVIAFYGVGYRHLFERQFDGLEFAPGEQLNYQFGVGFSVNDRVTLSATFFGFYISNTLVDRSALQGTNVEPMSMRFAATIARNERIVEPFAQIGMTDFAPAASFGVTITCY